MKIDAVLSGLLIALILAAPRGLMAQENPEGNQDSAREPIADEAAGPSAETNTGSDTEPATLAPRARYNRGLDLYREGKWQGAAEAFLQARDEGGADSELRYRAAFNLGVSLANQADDREAEDPEEAIEILRRSAAWFQDAIRLGSDQDEDTRINLEVVLKRIQQLADQLNQGNRLEARLDRVIDDQRGLRDRIRRLLQTVESAGVAAEPLGFQEEFDGLAIFERTLGAEVGSVSDLAADERAGLDGKTEEELNDEERSRRIQLLNLDLYLQEARQSLSDSRRRLRRLEGKRAHRRADAALAELKRAREQLLDPVTVLKGIAQDETELLRHTRGLEALRSDAIRIDPARPSPPRAWLTDSHLEERQKVLELRNGEVHARLDAGVAGDDPTGEPADPARQRIIEAVRQAIPFVEAASAAMQETIVAIPSGDLGAAADSETRAIQALLEAIERFAGVRDLIELAFGEQIRIITLLTPPDGSAGRESPLTGLSTRERTGMIRSGVTRNRERLGRLERLLEEERRETEERARQEAGPGAPPEDLESLMQGIGQKYDLAEQLRRQADTSIADLGNRLETLDRGGSAGDLGEPAEEGRKHLEELRRLFFSIVEHLEELLREQADTHDQTATVQFEEQDRQQGLGLADERQARHSATGETLSGALARQADASAEDEDPRARESQEALAEAATEVRAAAGRMLDASGVLVEAVELADVQTTDLEPALEAQIRAMEHLEEAIRLLRSSSQDREQQQGQQPQQQQQQEDEEMSQRQASRRLQAIRDREAERQRRNRQQESPEPVEKDW